MLKLQIQLFAKKNVKITQKQQDGTLLELYPVTNIANVEGLSEALKKTLQPYDSSTTYASGDIVIHENGIYKANASTTGTWDSSKWDLVATKDYNDLLNKPTIDTDNQRVKAGNVTFGSNDVVDIKGSGVISVTGNATNKDITISTTAQANVLEGVQLNGTDLSISNKKVNVQIKQNGTLLTNTSGAVDVITPTKTSDLTNDGDGTNAFITNATAQIGESQVNNLTTDLQNIREVAEGKTATYVVSDVTNTEFNSQADTITLTSSVTDTQGNTITLVQLKIGDNFLVTETNVPDRWVSAITKSGSTVTSVTLNKLETAKVDIAKMVETPANDTVLTTDKIVVGNNNNKTVKTSGVGIETSSTTTLTNVDTAVPTTKVLRRELDKKLYKNGFETSYNTTSSGHECRLGSEEDILIEALESTLTLKDDSGEVTVADILGKLDDSQLVTSWSSPTSDNNIPSEKLVKDNLDKLNNQKQDKLLFNKTTLNPEKEYISWETKTWSGLTDFNPGGIWTDGENIYYSYGDNYVLDKATSTWSEKTWTGLTSFRGENIWTDGENIYFSSSTNQYVLNKATSTWSTKTWTGLTDFQGLYIWTDGKNIYYSNNSSHYVLNRSTSTWSAKTWNGLSSFNGSGIWTDGENIYCNKVTGSAPNYTVTNYILNVSTSTFEEITFNGFIFRASNIWTDGENIYCSNSSNVEGNTGNFVLDKYTRTWSAITINGNVHNGHYIWTDGENIYYSIGESQYVLRRNNVNIQNILSKKANVSELLSVKTSLQASIDTKLTASTAKVQLIGDVTSTAVSLINGTASVSTTLANSGVTAGTYSAVQVNTKGLVTTGGQVIEVDSGSGTPSSDLVVGGIFFQEVTSS